MRKKFPTAKVFVSLVLIAGIVYYVFACYEMHRLNDISALPEISGHIATLSGAALGCYVWRAKESDKFTLEMMRAKIKKVFDLDVKSNPDDEQLEYFFKHYDDEPDDSVG